MENCVNQFGGYIAKFKTKPRKPLLFDMDDTLFLTTEHMMEYVKKHFNVPDSIVLKSRQYFWGDVGQCFGVGQEYFQDILSLPKFFATIPVDPIGVAVVSVLQQLGFPVGFLTAPQYNFHCIQEKIEALNKHFPWFDEKKHFFGAWDKRIFDGILIDDNISHRPDILFQRSYNIDHKAPFVGIKSFLDLPFVLFQLGYMNLGEYEEVKYYLLKKSLEDLRHDN